MQNRPFLLSVVIPPLSDDAFNMIVFRYRDGKQDDGVRRRGFSICKLEVSFAFIWSTAIRDFRSHALWLMYRLRCVFFHLVVYSRYRRCSSVASDPGPTAFSPSKTSGFSELVLLAMIQCGYTSIKEHLSIQFCMLVNSEIVVFLLSWLG